MKPRHDAVIFDLLTALLDSWTLWNAVAGGDEAGRQWRAAYLRNTYGTGAYRPYEALVAEAADEVGLPSSRAAELAPVLASRATICSVPLPSGAPLPLFRARSRGPLVDCVLGAG